MKDHTSADPGPVQHLVNLAKGSSTSQRIVSSARKLVIAGGYNGFSYADISGEVGIRKASIHHHFPNKADLVRAVIADYRKDSDLGLKSLENRSTNSAQLLDAYVILWSESIMDGRLPFCAAAMLASELPLLPLEVAAEVRGYFKHLSAWLAAVLKKGKDEGSLVYANSPEEEASAFTATLYGAMFLARARGDPAEFLPILNAALHRLVPHDAPKRNGT